MAIKRHTLAVLSLLALSACAGKPHFVVEPPSAPRLTLSPWSDSMSDGCTVPKPYNILVKFTPEQTSCCRIHDRIYYSGGSKLLRAETDANLGVCFVEHGLPDAEAVVAVGAVVVAGGPERMKPYSWGFGQGVRYGMWGYTPEPFPIR